MHPKVFQGLRGHPKDPLFPIDLVFSDPRVAYFDIWCQLMIRAIIAIRTPYLLNDLLQLDDPLNSGLSGQLVAFEANLEGDVKYPDQWEIHPLTTTNLYLSGNGTTFTSTLNLKTHYIYSVTASASLSGGRSYGLLILRTIDSVKENGERIVKFSCSPLMIGCGGGALLNIP